MTFDLGDRSIWLDWHPYENGRDGGTRGFMMTNSNFQYQTIKDSDAINVVLNGQQLSFGQAPVILNDRVLVPMRVIFEALGAEVDWLPAKGYRVVAYKGNKEVTLAINSTNMVVNKNTIALDAPAILYNDYTLVPVRAVSEALDANVSWDGNTKTVNISAK